MNSPDFILVLVLLFVFVPYKYEMTKKAVIKIAIAPIYKEN